MKKFPALFLAILALGSLWAQSNARIALVIGNAAYKEVPTLKNPVNDAKDLSAALKRMGWRTIEAFDVDRKAMFKAVNAFRDALKGAEESTALFYYAGHGVQIDGKNFLLPLGETFETPDDIKIGSLPLDSVLDAYDEGGALTCVTILDACRENPFAKAKTRAIGSTRGLSVVPAVEAEGGSATIFATGAGDVAQDGTGRNGIFTAALLKHVEENKSLGDIFVAVAKDVKQATGGKQNPYLNSSGIVTAIYLNDPRARKEAEAAAALAASTGKLRVEADFEGMAYAEGEMLGSVSPGRPLTAENIPVGTLSIRFEPKDDSEAQTATAEIGAGGTSSVSFKRSRAAGGSLDRFILSVKGPEADLAVRLDGEIVGYTPYMADVPAGQHLVEIVNISYEDFCQTIEGRGGEKVEIDPPMEYSVVFKIGALRDEQAAHRVTASAKVRKGGFTIGLNVASWVSAAAGATLAGIALFQSAGLETEYRNATNDFDRLRVRLKADELQPIYQAGIMAGGLGLGTGIVTTFMLPNTKTENEAIQDLEAQIRALSE